MGRSYTKRSPFWNKETEPMNQQASASPRAAARSEPVREGIRQRKRKGGGSSDRFHIDPSAIPAGTSYEWKRHKLLGASDPAYDVENREQGWEPVDVSRHPNFMPDGHQGAIIRDGLILMERPMELTREAQEEDRVNALSAVRAKEAQLSGAPAGTMERVKPTVNKGYDMPMDEGMEIPE
jgi:hypothetical protein